MARTSVADVLIEGLVRAGTARLFTAPGAFGAGLDAAARRGLPVVDAGGAPEAVVLAAVTGEVSEAPGALIAGLDDAPGLVRGLAHAQRDRAPLVAITGAGRDAGLLAPVVKASLVVEPASAAHWIAHAAQLGMADPRGPVHLIVAAEAAGAPALPVATAVRRAPLPPPSGESLEGLGAALEAATRPLLITGLECGPDDARWVRAFSEALPAPVLATAKGRGVLPEPHPLALGAAAADHPALAAADLVLLVGVDAGELPPGIVPAGARSARIGRAPWTGGRLAAEALGDLALVIEELAPRVRARPAADWDVAALDRMKRAVARRAAAAPAARIVALAREATPAGTLVTGDLPALAAWQAVAPRETLTPLGHTVPGYPVLAAVAASLAHRDRGVVAFAAPEALAAAEPAWAVALALGLPIVAVLLGGPDGVRDEAAFTAELARALAAARPAVIGVHPQALSAGR